MSDIDLSTLRTFPTDLFDKSFRRQAYQLLFKTGTLPNSLLRDLQFDPLSPDFTSQFPLFQTNFPILRTFPNFSTLYLLVCLTSIPPSFHPLIFDFLMELTPNYSDDLLTILLTLIFHFFSDSTHFPIAISRLSARCSLSLIIPPYCCCLRAHPENPVFYSPITQFLHDPSLSSDLRHLICSTLSLLNPTDPASHAALSLIQDELGCGFLKWQFISDLPGDPDLLDRLLEAVESGHPPSIGAIAGQLKKLPFPPLKSFRPLFELCLRSSSPKLDIPTLLILGRIHEIVEQSENIFRLYLELMEDPGISKDRLCQAYQLFVCERNGVLPNGESIPVSLIPGRVVETPGDLAIELLMNFSTAYDGIIALWNVMKKTPTFDLEARFVTWRMVHKCFLVSGFKEKASKEGETWAYELIGRLQEMIRWPQFDPEAQANRLEERMGKIMADVRNAKMPERISRPRNVGIRMTAMGLQFEGLMEPMF